MYTTNSVGDGVGTAVGVVVGASVGAVVGDGVGGTVGESDGGGFKHRHTQLPEPSTYAEGIASGLQLHKAAVQSVGADVGVTVGAAVGAVGVAVGADVGDVGVAVGASVGLAVGAAVGDVGVTVGAAVGAVGVAVGAFVGAFVGVAVGVAVGDVVGLVGVAVGVAVGVVVGASVGVVVGGVVGTAVGESVGGGFKHRHAQLPKSSRYGDGIASGLQLHTSVVHSCLRCLVPVFKELDKSVFDCSVPTSCGGGGGVQRKQGQRSMPEKSAIVITCSCYDATRHMTVCQRSERSHTV